MSDESDEALPEGFEVFDKTTGPPLRRDDPYVRLMERDDTLRFRLSAETVRFLGEPEYARFYYNAELDQVAIGPAAEDDPNAYNLANNSLHCSRLMRRLKLRDAEAPFLWDDPTLADTDDDAGQPLVILDIAPLREREEADT